MRSKYCVRSTLMLVGAILIGLLTSSCAKKKCYECAGYEAGFYTTASNVCGDTMLRYYVETKGWDCWEATSGASITGYEDNVYSNEELIDSDCH